MLNSSARRSAYAPLPRLRLFPARALSRHSIAAVGCPMAVERGQGWDQPVALTAGPLPPQTTQNPRKLRLAVTSIHEIKTPHQQPLNFNKDRNPVTRLIQSMPRGVLRNEEKIQSQQIKSNTSITPIDSLTAPQELGVREREAVNLLPFGLFPLR